jgi:hypothetical protein
MSPENYGVFQLMKEVTFRRIFGILQLTKMGPFWGASVRGSVRSDWLVGLAYTLLALRNVI